MNQLHARTGLVCRIIGQHKTKKNECLRNLVSVLSWHSLTYHFVIYFDDFHFVLLAKREREGEREGDIDR